jgi:hypothetical protein
MPNLRVISDNAIDRATLASPSTAANFDPNNLKLARKSDVWRASGIAARLSAAWTAPESIQAVALPFCSLSPTATMRVRVTNELQATNLLPYPNDFTQGVWTRASVTVTSGVPGADGGATSASTLTATAGNATISQARTVTAGNFTSSVWIRRRTGTGTISIRNAANTAWLPLAVTSGWTRFTNDSGATGTSAQFSLQIANSGDAIDVCFAQLEAGSVATSYYDGTRPLGYIDSWQAYSYDSGQVLACPAAAVRLRGFTAAQAATAYAFGGGACARHWLPTLQQAYGLAVDIVDLNNVPGYIEAAFLAAGPYWEATTNPDYGVSITHVDSSKNDRNDAGDLISDAGTMSKKLSLPMSFMGPTDQNALWSILRGSGIRYPLFASLFPENPDLELERKFQVYGKFVQLPAMVLPRFNYASATVEIESV